MTRWQRFAERWGNCQDCPLHRTRQHVVLAKGQIPCDIMFVGEAPGQSEDVIGKPFIGPAGRLLDEMIKEVIGDPNSVTPCGVPYEKWSTLRLAFTNLICCIPLDEETLAKTEQPPVESIMACQQRLREFVDLARPKLMVLVGSLAEDWIDSRLRGGLIVDCPKVVITHPAAILRSNVAQQGTAVRRCVVKLRTAVKEVFGDA